ncbi:MAG TPA: cache domain-containing protein [Candidatus Limnocylindria bacterium]|jgi:hypothetical protein|nr:cache domain-containing protein [Candidatus Limnocylindria bacterium]
MKLGLRTRLVAMLLGAVVISSGIGAIAARQTMAADLDNLAAQQVLGGATGFGGYWDQKRDAVKLLVTQTAINEAVVRATAARDTRALETTLSGIAHDGGLAFLTVVDAHGRVLARANSGPPGAMLASPLVARALTGETVSTAARIPHDELEPEQLVPQIESTTAGREGLLEGLALIAATPISNADERTTGAVYGGVLLDHDYDVVDQVTRALGGKAAVIFEGELISSSISRPDGTRLVDDAPSALVRTRTSAFTGVDREGGTDYLVRIEPILDDQNTVVATRWFGVPLAQFGAVQRHAIVSLVLWGLVGVVIALAFTLPLVERLARALIARSRQIRASAQELSLVIVGSEVSGDHVAQTRAAVERQGKLLMHAATGAEPGGEGAIATAHGVSEAILAASALNVEILGDVVVIDTLAQEMAERTQQAVARVGELNDVAAALDALVNG